MPCSSKSVDPVVVWPATLSVGLQRISHYQFWPAHWGEESSCNNNRSGSVSRRNRFQHIHASINTKWCHYWLNKCRHHNGRLLRESNKTMAVFSPIFLMPRKADETQDGKDPLAEIWPSFMSIRWIGSSGCSDWDTGWTTEESWLDTRRGKRFFFSPTTSTPALRPNHRLTQSVPRDLSSWPRFNLGPLDCEITIYTSTPTSENKAYCSSYLCSVSSFTHNNYFQSARTVTTLIFNDNTSSPTQLVLSCSSAVCNHI